jgi:hypothetical protein
MYSLHIREYGKKAQRIRLVSVRLTVTETAKDIRGTI